MIAGMPADESSYVPPPTQGFMTEVKKEMDLSPEQELRQLDDDRDASGLRRRVPPYLSTINNLGLNNTPGMPNLVVRMPPGIVESKTPDLKVSDIIHTLLFTHRPFIIHTPHSLQDYVLHAHTPAQTPAESRRWLERLLRLPPPPAVALQLHQACRYLSLWSARVCSPCPSPSYMQPTLPFPSYIGVCQPSKCPSRACMQACPSRRSATSSSRGRRKRGRLMKRSSGH